MGWEMLKPHQIYCVGKEGNAWDNEKTGEKGFSKGVDLKASSNVSIFGVIDAQSEMSVFVSQDGIHYYYCHTISQTLSPEPPPARPEWSSGVDYAEGDIVKYTPDDTEFLYICIQDHKSNPSRTPTNQNYWLECQENNTEGEFPKEFHTFETIGARYVKLQSENDVTATVTVVGKP